MNANGTGAGTVAAVDLGATSGRVMLGHISKDAIRLEAVHRFDNRPVRTLDGLHWSIVELYRDAVEGLAIAARRAPALAGIGVDTWAVDYALMRRGNVLGLPYSYRDDRTNAAVDSVHRTITPEALYVRNGLQHLPFNTVFQLVADQQAGLLDVADRFLLLPDLFGYWLTGTGVAERTNASTTGLLNAGTGDWDRDIAGELGIPARIFPELVAAGTELGTLTASARRGIGDSTARVISVGSHDTASAVVALPTTSSDSAYISCGTWSLVGVELEHPILTDEARRSGFTNEGGVDGRTRFLHNVMGLWLLSECVREWRRTEERVSLAELLEQAERVSEPVPIFDADDETFLAPGDMPRRIEEWLVSHDRPVPTTRAALVRSILLSLARSYASAIRQAAQLSGKTVNAIHIVGGGSLNALLCQLTADAAGLPVIAGPAEATALGNVLVQARALGWVSGDLETLRALVIRDTPTIRYDPR
ncbi:rhamnulokinase [Leifsonia sp. 21MFCrub1.1]|uniref:rhamnulokinase n=1 Tax=Leifsonia sp. 21MFCrub1.1 TaxID=1798223 RepID=UPI0008928486|nr:rhamnulokinase family protein [Leifsonia sp. 21MFCrub1.1]SEB08404.1 rhamnulokinase [Leifsonia sp. 21MFCrub1.1]